ncbi:hypothetical protein RP20_CCG020141 [Aedes albopictus]|nr:hypothetical protein RP20_CCG020141 [Aedes albopictus]
MTEQLPAAKRTYTRRSPLCRLCMQQYPKNDLQEIFSRGSPWKKRIFRATGIKPHRNDPVTRMCSTCRMMVDTIVTFQEICQQTELLMRKGAGSCPIVVEDDQRWDKVAGLIESLFKGVTQHRQAVMLVNSTDGGDGTTTTIETEQEIFQVSQVDVPPGEEEYLQEESGEEEEGASVMGALVEQLPLDIKKEEEVEEEEQENDQDSDYQYEDEQESDEEDSEDEQRKPKKKRNRKRENELNRLARTAKVVCDTCGELVSQVSLEGHLNRHLGVKPFVCEIEGCGRRLYSKYSLQQHRHLHKSIMRYYDCPDCGKRMKGTSCWMRHKKMHTEEPKHECNVCGKKFRRKFGLKLHSVVHTGVAQFPCEICGKRFNVKHNLGAHYKTHKRNGTWPEMQTKEEYHQEIYYTSEQNN